jgi:hypothetical protein
MGVDAICTVYASIEICATASNLFSVLFSLEFICHFNPSLFPFFTPTDTGTPINRTPTL